MERVLLLHDYIISAFSRAIHAEKTLNFDGLCNQIIEAHSQTLIQEVGGNETNRPER